ncbi:MAG: DUF262 domain-containing protein [Bacteroidales bacterium]|nr:DUF262 domain-containing protein [Bacteroidales bacterium]MDY6170642.1 DUF262 domain-containing protein [Candidatus Cryptobacteroides sp.]
MSPSKFTARNSKQAIAIPENDYQKFKSGDEYFLGPIVTFKNSDGKLEIIDGQQRLTTLMLLLRALYIRPALEIGQNGKETFVGLS